MNFSRREVMYLSHCFSENGVKPDPEKVKSVVSYPIPTNQREIRSFLGLSGFYRRFIKDYSKITKPLTSLLKKNTIFNWTSSQQESFENLKKQLISTPILQYPNFQKEFILTTDASNFAIGAILSQITQSQDLPIAYASRTLNRAESNYSTIERELLAIIWAVKHFRPYLYGRRFKIISDHKPLLRLFNFKDPSSRLFRWRLKLEEHDFTVEYRPGKKNGNADALTRIPPLEIKDLTLMNLSRLYNSSNS